jgi:hypothetical protein
LSRREHFLRNEGHLRDRTPQISRKGNGISVAIQKTHYIWPVLDK